MILASLEIIDTYYNNSICVILTGLNIGLPKKLAKKLIIEKVVHPEWLKNFDEEYIWQ